MMKLLKRSGLLMLALLVGASTAFGAKETAGVLRVEDKAKLFSAEGIKKAGSGPAAANGGAKGTGAPGGIGFPAGMPGGGIAGGNAGIPGGGGPKCTPCAAGRAIVVGACS